MLPLNGSIFSLPKNKPPLFGVSQMGEVGRWIRAQPGATGSEGGQPPQSANADSSPIPCGTGEP